jgi:hypothetical protein
MGEKYDEAFRISVTSGLPSLIGHYGPYATLAAARGQATTLRRSNQRRYWSDEDVPTFEAHIEKSSASWTRVDE